MIGVGLGLTGIVLGLRPRLAAWPLALTAVAALLYRDPNRVTPDLPAALFAPADGTVIGIDELYEHRFLHTDAVRVAIAVAPFDVPVQRSPVDGMVTYLDHQPGEYRSIWDLRADEYNERQYVGIAADWGPLLLTLVAGPLARKIVCHVERGDRLSAGDRISTVRFGARVDLVLPLDEVAGLPTNGDRLRAGVTQVGRLTRSRAP